jgi:hopanoid biosynthesis associated protein HpnK
MSPQRKDERYLVFSADDLGRSRSVNEAVAEAFDLGLLTATSVMAGGEALAGAVEAAKAREGLSLGIHVALCDGKAVLPHEEIPDITAPDGTFPADPSAVWIGLVNRKIREQAEREIGAQFDRLAEVGLAPAYLDAHHHLHMQPQLFGLVCRIAAERGVSWIRIPSEPARVVYGMAKGGRGGIAFVEHAVFAALIPSARREAARHGLRCADIVYGLSHTGRMSEELLLEFLNDMAHYSSGGCVCEIFCHPDTATPAGRTELLALKSDAVAARMDSFGIRAAGFRDLS